MNAYLDLKCDMASDYTMQHAGPITHVHGAELERLTTSKASDVVYGMQQ